MSDSPSLYSMMTHYETSSCPDYKVFTIVCNNCKAPLQGLAKYLTFDGKERYFCPKCQHFITHSPHVAKFIKARNNPPQEKMRHFHPPIRDNRIACMNCGEVINVAIIKSYGFFAMRRRIGCARFIEGGSPEEVLELLYAHQRFIERVRFEEDEEVEE